MIQRLQLWHLLRLISQWKNGDSLWGKYYWIWKEKEIILRDPKNYIPDDDTIYDIMREFDGYDDIYRETEQYKMNIIKIWDEYKTKSI